MTKTQPKTTNERVAEVTDSEDQETLVDRNTTTEFEDEQVANYRRTMKNPLDPRGGLY